MSKSCIKYFTLDISLLDISQLIWVYEFFFQCVITDNGLFSRLVVVVLLNRGLIGALYLYVVNLSLKVTRRTVLI